MSSCSAPSLQLPGEMPLDHDEPPSRREAPLEQVVGVAPEMLAGFEDMPEVEASADGFNDLGRRIPRDNSNRVRDVAELIERVNEYDYSLPSSMKLRNSFLMAMTCGYASRRRTIPAGYLGHYVSAGRHMLTPAGRVTLKGPRDEWLDNEPVDDPTNLIREFGIKTLIVVPENHIAGAFRMSCAAKGEASDEASYDGEFVLLGQGRHVLDSSFYNEVVMNKLESNQVQVGPVTVLYVKEGFIGGAFERARGVYRILQPGRPYLLHEKDYEQIELVECSLKPFSIGPISFLTVKDGELGGAYRKSTGQYQLLPPGNVYQLHSKEFEGIQLVQRTNLFKLGPLTFITVQKGFVAGAFRKKGGEFMLLQPGQTYQLNEDEFEDPCIVKRDQHVVKCGPLTFLTLQEGVLTGAYRTKDGHFEEFSAEDEQSKEFVLHERDYHGLTVVNKYSTQVQDFGPNKIITIPEGVCGVFEREGAIEIKEAGFYKVSAEYRILENIPLHVNSERFVGQEFLTKDSVKMHVSLVIVWQVRGAVVAAKWPGTFAELRNSFRSKAASSLVMLLRTFNRSQLLPTRQDVLSTEGASEEGAVMEEVMKRAAEASKQVQTETEESCLQLLNDAAVDGRWGVEVVSVKIDSLDLADERIIADLQSIAHSQLAMKRKQMEAHAMLAAATVEREAAMHKANATAEVSQTKAESEARMKLAEAKAQSEIALMEATNAARAQAEANKIELDMQVLMAESQTTIEETKLRAKRLEAETEAAAIRALAEANYEKGCKEQQVAAMMPSQELEIKRMELAMEGMKNFGHAAWRHPEEMNHFWDQLKPYVRLGPMSAGELATAKQNVTAALSNQIIPQHQ